MPSERDCVEHLLKLAKATKTRKLQLQETIALGLLVSLKWDKAKWEKPPNYLPSPDELVRHGNFTETEFSNYRENAREMLDQYLEKEVSRRQWWSGVGQGVTAALIWSVVLFGIGAVAIKSQGGDIGSLIREFTVERGKPVPPSTDAGHPK